MLLKPNYTVFFEGGIFHEARNLKDIKDIIESYITYHDNGQYDYSDNDFRVHSFGYEFNVTYNDGELKLEEYTGSEGTPRNLVRLEYNEDNNIISFIEIATNNVIGVYDNTISLNIIDFIKTLKSNNNITII